VCGIAGALVFTGVHFDISDKYITGMRDTMAHRGPDGAGVWISGDRRSALAHRRLSIIDLSESANQPMTNEDGSIVLAYNGEIYNHAEIRAELEKTGNHHWKTDHSDTEVIIHAYEEWGTDCLEKFRGMFAFALWDKSRKRMWLVRDRIGIKPLYYSVHHGRIVFASEIKAILKDPEISREVNEEAMYHYLSFLTTPAPLTMFDGINKLPCGTWITVDADGRMIEQRYWDVWDHTGQMRDVSEDEIAARLLEELRESVRLRKVSDVPVGVFLSGGIDSSTNAQLFSEGETQKIKTFTIGYEGEYDSYRNEVHFAKMMADRVGAEYHERLLTVDDLIDFLPRMVHLQDEPIADPVCVPVYYVSKLARDNGVIVCQVGEGADELFWGYPGWEHALGMQRKYGDFPAPLFMKRLALLGLGLMGKTMGPRYETLRRISRAQPVFWGGAEAFTEEQKKRLLSQRLEKKFSGMTSWEAISPIRRRFEEKAWEKSHLNWMSYLDLNYRLPELLLMRVDKMSMGVSLEARVPFLDHKFVELAMSIPEPVKTRNGELKYILKKAVRGVIPDKLIDRKKQGFGVPVYEWFFDRLGDKTRAELENICRETDFFDSEEIDRLAAEGVGTKLWYVLNFAMWWKHNID